MAVANLDGGDARDVYAMTGSGELWRFNLETGHLVAESPAQAPTALASLELPGGDAVFYGSADGVIYDLEDSFPAVQVGVIGGSSAAFFRGQVVFIPSNALQEK